MTKIQEGDNIYLKTDTGEIFIRILHKDRKTDIFTTDNMTDGAHIKEIRQGKRKAWLIDLRDTFQLIEAETKEYLEAISRERSE